VRLAATQRADGHSRVPPTKDPRAGSGLHASVTDYFASSKARGRGGEKIHLRVQQRNGRKCITTIQGLDDLDLKSICKAMKRTFSCNGSIQTDPEHGEIIQLQGDQRKNSREWIIEQKIVARAEAKDRLVLHGF
jgi:translation initiation factor 1